MKTTRTLLLVFSLALALTAPPIIIVGAQGKSDTRVFRVLNGQGQVPSIQQTAASQTATTTLRLAGLQSGVTVRRDGRGVPYIEARNENDLYFAQGYATAADRLWQMDLLRRTARGELAEIFGRTVLEEDKRRRTYGFARIAEATAAQLTPATRAPLEAYARGVNAFIESLDANALPPEFRILQYRPRAWTAADSIVIGKLLFELLSTTWQTDLMRAAFADLPASHRALLFPVTSPLDVIIVGSDRASRRARVSDTNNALPSEAFNPISVELLRAISDAMAATEQSFSRAGLNIDDRAASNNWVVAGRRTATGKPLLANDPHLPPGAPSIWHLAHLSAPGLRVAGVTFPGAPGIVIGHNERIAWGMTNLGPDVQDLYRETFDPQNPRRYRTPEGWREAEVRREEIRVRRSPVDASTETVVHEVMVTRHGPIILERNATSERGAASERYALRWTALDASAGDLAAFYGINRARNWNEFRAALRNYTGPTQNFIYADTENHIGYYGAGRIPVRRSGDGSLPYDGGTDAGEWTGFVPFDELPHVYDPPSGMIVTANSRIVGTDYPHHLTHEWASPFRARRIYDLLQATPRLTVDDFRRIQGDTHSIGGATFAREVVRVFDNASEAATTASSNRNFTEAVRLFREWNNRVDADSRVPPLLAEMRASFRRRILVHLVGEERASAYRWANDPFLDRIITERPAELLPPEFRTYGDLLRACYEDARAALTRQLGADEAQWTWGRVAQVRFNHPLAAVPLVGAPFTIQPFPQYGSGFSAGASPNVGAGVSMRFIADASNWDNSQQGITPGESGIPSSPHWADQIADWRAVRPRILPFSPNAVVGATRQTLVISPAEEMNKGRQQKEQEILSL